MGYIVTGLNYKKTPLSIREKFAYNEHDLAQLLSTIRENLSLKELVIVSTCNRTEIIGVGSLEQLLAVWDLMLSFNEDIDFDLRTTLYIYYHDQAVKHIFKVACSLDSMVVGESQILGQLKKCYWIAQKTGMVSQMLHQLFQHAFFVAKKVRTYTKIGRLPVSVAYMTVHLAKRIFENLTNTTVLMLGAGDTIRLVTQHFKSQGISKLIVANRNLDSARYLEEEFNAEIALLSSVPELLHRADIVVASTASPTIILGKGSVESALIKRKHNPILMIDIAVPRDIESAVGELDDVFLYTIDDLQAMTKENMNQRSEDIVLANKIIVDQVTHFMGKFHSLNALEILKLYRHKNNKIKEDAIKKAYFYIEKGQNPKKVIAMMAKSLTNQLTHAPSLQIRDSAFKGSDEKLEWAQKILDIDGPRYCPEKDKVN